MVLPDPVEQDAPQPINFYKKWLERLTHDELDEEINRLKSKAESSGTQETKYPHLRLVK